MLKIALKKANDDQIAQNNGKMVKSHAKSERVQIDLENLVSAVEQYCMYQFKNQSRQEKQRIDQEYNTYRTTLMNKILKECDCVNLSKTSSKENEPFLKPTTKPVEKSRNSDILPLK